MQSTVHAWKSALPDGSPSGEDLSFAPEFEALRAEVEKSESVHAMGSTDWSTVKLACTDLLSTRSKDLWLLAYGVYASYKADGFDACPVAFACLNDLLESHWETLFPAPQRPLRRLAPLRWLHTRMSQCAGDSGFSLEAPDIAELLRAQCTRLDIFLGEKYGDDAPSFLSIFNTPVMAVQAEIPPSVLDSELVSPPAPSSASGAAPSAAAPATPMTSTLERMDTEGRVPSAVLPQLVRGVMDQTRQLAGHFLSLNVCDERAYLLHRAGLWGTLLHLPPADSSGLTQMSRGVPQEKVQAYAAALENRQYGEVLPQLERSAVKAPYWLDGHYMVARCLEALKADAALECVRAALSRLLERFPELLTYKFRDGSPFASPKVVPWLEALLERRNAAEASGAQGSTYGTGGTAGKSPALAADEESLLQAALALHAEKGFAEGLRSLARVPAGRHRAAIMQGLLQARYCLATGHKAAARNLLAALYAQLEQWELLDWEPELSARTLTQLLSLGPRQRGQNEELLRRLFWFDPDAAITLSPEN